MSTGNGPGYCLGYWPLGRSSGTVPGIRVYIEVYKELKNCI